MPHGIGKILDAFRGGERDRAQTLEHLPPRFNRYAARLWWDKEISGRPPLERLHPFLRIFPRRQRRRPWGQPSNRVDRNHRTFARYVCTECSIRLVADRQSGPRSADDSRTSCRVGSHTLAEFFGGRFFAHAGEITLSLTAFSSSLRRIFGRIRELSWKRKIEVKFVFLQLALLSAARRSAFGLPDRMLLGCHPPTAIAKPASTTPRIAMTIADNNGRRPA
jgi:hypothetical protein